MKKEQVKPNVSIDKKVILKNAFHPLLFQANEKENIKTYPQGYMFTIDYKLNFC